MDFLSVHSTNIWVMGLLVVLSSGVAVYFIKRIHYLVFMMLSGLAGFGYAYFSKDLNLAALAIFLNMLLSLAGVGIGKLTFIVVKQVQKRKSMVQQGSHLEA